MLKLAAGAVLISFSAVFVKWTTVAPTVSAFYRMFFGGLVLLLLVTVRRERLWFGRAAAVLIAASGLCFAADLFFWHRSILYIGPGLSTLLANFQVFTMALVGILFLGDPLRWETLVSIPLALLGLILLVGFDWSTLPASYPVGVSFGLLAALCYTGSLLCMRATRTQNPAPSAMALTVLMTLICTAALAVMLAAEGVTPALPTWQDVGVLLAYGVVSQVVGWLLITSSLPGVPASQVGLILLLQPTLSILWDVLLFGRRFTAVELAGAGLALAAIYLGSLRRS
jgi:drug/metabolite transporter (DMT)-like permease